MSSATDRDVVVAPTAEVSPTARIGTGTRLWNHVHVREGAQIGTECVVGDRAYIDHDVVIGDRCKIQNNALIYYPALIGSGVFVGPGAILSNDVYPRAIRPDGALKDDSDWDPVGVKVGDGASIGAGAVVIGGVTVGQWAVVAAGAVVTRSVPDYALVMGVPARSVAWVGRSGRRLQPAETGEYVDPENGDRYVENEGRLECLT